MIFGIEIWIFIFLVACLTLVSLFEFINWFHANAVAPVIYTKSLKAKYAVLISWFMNFLWVMLWWIWVAMAIIHLLPLAAIGHQSTAFGIVVVISLLLSAIIWNFATWYFWIPASSSHSLIWAILWVTIMMQFIIPMEWWIKVSPNWAKAGEVIEALLLSPVLWFALATILMIISYRFIKSKYYFSTPSRRTRTSPKSWLRFTLIWTSAWVSFAHGSNDWQKWVWLAMLILVLLVPWSFAINPDINKNELNNNIIFIEKSINSVDLSNLNENDKKIFEDTEKNLLLIKETLNSWTEIDKLKFREAILIFQENMKNIWNLASTNTSLHLKTYATSVLDSQNASDNNLFSSIMWSDFDKNVDWVSTVIDYAPIWIIFLISVSLWLWTLIWRKRIVKTIWEKIWKTDMNYAQATTSAFITAITITLASKFHLPVSTTHILSSSVAWTMSTWPDSWWVRKWTVKNILMAWVLTLPVTMVLSAFLFLIFWYIFVR